MIDTRPVCDYEGSDYQADFWDTGEREYEDRVERAALKALLPRSGRLFLELGAGTGRQTALLAAFAHVVLLDYSRSQLRQAQARLGHGPRYTYVAANVYRLPFAPAVFDAAMMIRVVHHLVDVPAALTEIHRALSPGGTFVLEFANKRNWKAMLRYLLRRQTWSPFAPEPVEFVRLNFDFHPRAMRGWLAEAGFAVERQRTVSHFRVGWLKRLVPARLLAAADALLQPTGDWAQFSPSVFVRCGVTGGPHLPGVRPDGPPGEIDEIFRCPVCKSQLERGESQLACTGCGRRWAVQEGIYDFKEAR